MLRHAGGQLWANMCNHIMSIENVQC